MPDPITQGSSLAGDVDTALATLDAALVDARRAVDVIRSSLSQIAGLERRVREMEAAMSRALESLTAQMEQTPRPAGISQLRPVAVETPQQLAAAIEPQPAPARVSHCLRLTVQSKSGSLDLKAVDGAVNDNQDVVDVALLDYDGREATLKLWINPEVDTEGVRQALLESLKNELGDDGSADAYIDYEEAA
jgi:hypothetical protein